MFQYAAAPGLAVRQDRTLKMEVSAFAAYKNRSYQLDCLKVPQDLYTGAPLFQPVSNSIAARLIRRIKREVFKGYVFKGGAFRKPFPRAVLVNNLRLVQPVDRDGPHSLHKYWTKISASSMMSQSAQERLPVDFIVE